MKPSRPPLSSLPSGRTLALAAALVATAGGAAAQSAAALNTRALVATCAACHGTDGKAVAGQAMIPLAGRAQADIVAQMKAFRDGSRTATVMHQLAKGYSDEQIEAMAAYFAAVK